MKYEVRCCCDAEKLLGWMDLELNGLTRCAFPIPMERFDPRPDRFGVVHQFGKVALPVVTVRLHDREYKAIKADGVPVETLRRIPAFIDANPEWISLDDLRLRLLHYRREHDDQMPQEPLHFRLEQWARFRLERASPTAIDEPAGKPRTVFGLSVELHPSLDDVPHDSAPELWQRTRAT